jgi:riboflavin synthase
MFTGLIEAVGHVAQVAPSPAGFRLRLQTALAPELRAGDSVAVNGVCLTVVAASGGTFDTDVSPETARVTTLTTLAAGALVNLERPLRADARLGGHFVQGHVDATGSIAGLLHDGESHWLTVAFPRLLDPFLVRKGSIAVDGISLTVADLKAHSFDVQIIPFTWEHTNLQAARVARIGELDWQEKMKEGARP